MMDGMALAPCPDGSGCPAACLLLQVLLTLSEHDWAELNADPNVAHIIDQTFLTMDNHTVADTSGPSACSQPPVPLS